MNGGIDSRGYTILEVMIFLAISGLMFLVAASFVSGKQQKAEFKQGLFSLNSAITAAINDVGDGYFPDVGNFACQADDTGGALNFTGTSAQQGTHKGCVFIGKVIGFATDDMTGTDAKSYHLYTMAGRQYQTSPKDGKTPQSFAQAQPAAVNVLTEQDQFHGGMKLAKISDGGSTFNAIGFFTTFGQTVSGLYQSGGGTSVVQLNGTLGNFNPTAVVASAYDSGITAAPNIIMCFDSGGAEWGTLTIGGGQGQRLATRVRIYDSYNQAHDATGDIC